MIIRPLGTPLVKQCSRASLSSSTASKAAAAIAAPGMQSTLHQSGAPTESSIGCNSSTRCFSTTNNRTFSSIPHHLARKNNGMVNVFVKSTKVPRPIAMIPVKKNNQQPKKVKNQLKKQAERTAAPLLAEQSVKKPKVDALHHHEEHVPSHFSYAGNAALPITSELKIVLPEDDVPSGIWPVFRMMVR